MSDEEILFRSSEIRREASEILEIYKVTEVLKEFQSEIIGSYKIDLMYDRDIDIVVKSDDIERDSYESLLKFIKLKKFMKVQYGNFVNFPRKNRPKGYIINLFLDYNGCNWEVEIWFLKEIDLSVKENDKINSKLSVENRLTILKEKQKREEFNISKNELSSYKIYKKVLKI